MNRKRATMSKEQTLLIFLKETKAGKYAKVEVSSFDYIRIKEVREEILEPLDLFYYSVS